MKQREKPAVYVANQFGFHELGRGDLDEKIIPWLEEMDIRVLEPFRERTKDTDFSKEKEYTIYEERVKFWDKTCLLLGQRNVVDMEQSDAMLPLLDGGHAVDDGVALEMGFFSSLRDRHDDPRPIIALRTDIRLCDSPSSRRINAQLQETVYRSGGLILPTVASWLAAVSTWREAWPNRLKKWRKGHRMQ